MDSHWVLNSGELITLATTETREKAAGMHFQLILILLVLPYFAD